jgi:hypothetical protein
LLFLGQHMHRSVHKRVGKPVYRSPAGAVSLVVSGFETALAADPPGTRLRATQYAGERGPDQPVVDSGLIP